MPELQDFECSDVDNYPPSLSQNCIEQRRHIGSDRFRRTQSTKRVLPNVEATFNRAKSLRFPSNSHHKRYSEDSFQSTPRGMDSPSYLECRSQRPPGHTRKTGYRQVSTVSSTSTSLSPHRQMRGELRHQSRSFNASEGSPSENHPRPRRQLPVAVTISSSDERPSISSTIDDFDYFCRISHSKRTNVPGTCAGSEATKTRRQRLKNMRSHSMLHPTEINDDGTVGEPCAYRRALTHDQDTFEALSGCATPKMIHPGNPSRNNSAASLANSRKASYSPGRASATPQAPPLITLGNDDGCPLGAAISQEALDADDPDLVEFKVQLIGSPSVGKTTICQRLGNLNNANNEPDDSAEDIEDNCESVSVRATLDGTHFNVQFNKTVVYPADDSMNIEIQNCVDAYVVVYAIDDTSTFEFANRVLQILWESIQENSLPPAGFILVGNKFDLVRGREISPEEGMHCATSQKARFIEVSAVLDHKIPELLLTIITHLRELEEAKAQRPKHQPTNEVRGGPSRQIAVKISSNGDDVSGSAGAASTSTRPQRNPAKREIVRFFKKHFSKTITEGTMRNRDIAGGGGGN